MTIEEFNKFIDYMSIHIDLVSSISIYDDYYCMIFEINNEFYNFNLSDKEIMLIYPNNIEDKLSITNYQYAKLKDKLDNIVKLAKDIEYNKLKELIQ